MGEVIQLQPCDPVPLSFESVLSGNGNGICDSQKTEEEEYINGINKLSYLCKTLEKMDRVESREQVSQKKLHLVLDIDHTLVHSFRLQNASNLGLSEGDENEDTKLIDGFVVKLRPFVLGFLEIAHTMFQMSTPWEIVIMQSK
ncbi:NLI interacting factor [Corchorus olitorius]|uniref:protein-serine/threonine phosphatase n=1 Tax=Corchorus olitorius TaxID=93759 RepID=A0A1R3KJA1_9ROSI|nr:NLI interacting factor [Corchorus olitorius]